MFNTARHAPPEPVRPRPGRPNRRAWSLAAACALLALYAGGLAWEGYVGDETSDALTFPFVDRPAAQRAYRGLPNGAPASAWMAAARRLTWADPANPESWLALAAADARAHGALTPLGVEALDHAYAVSFFDRPGAVWRVGFAVQHWAALTPTLRQDVLDEAAAAIADPTLGPQLRRRLGQVTSPEGRLAASLILQPSGAG